jgi:hypothetical protein
METAPKTTHPIVNGYRDYLVEDYNEEVQDSGNVATGVFGSDF